MEKSNLCRFILIITIALSLVASLRAVCDDDDSTVEVLCSNNDFVSYKWLLPDPIFYAGILYEYSNESIYPEPLISYLARKEKSPPLSVPASNSVKI